MKKTPRQCSLDVRASSLALILAAFPFYCDAASLGRLSVWSGLGQPLRAEVEVSATPDELTTLIARIATPDMYRQAGLQFTAGISSLQVMVDRRGTRPIVRISSDRPMNEAFVDLLLELSWANGRLSREYTVLLDPVELPGGSRGAPSGAPLLALPETRMSPNLAQRGGGDARNLPPPGPGGLPPLPDLAQRPGSSVQAKALPSLKPNYAAPSEARLTPAIPAQSLARAPAPAPAPVAAAAPIPAPSVTAATPSPSPLPANGLDPRAASRSKTISEPPAAPAPESAPLALKQSVERLGAKAEPKVEVKAEPKPEPKPKAEPQAEPKSKVDARLSAKEAKHAMDKAIEADRDARLKKSLALAREIAEENTSAKPKGRPASLSPLEEELRAAERERLKQDAGRSAPAAEAAAVASSSERGGNTYTTQRGDTLLKIARETKPEEVSLEQMLVALFRNNESAFEGNMNRLKAGRILDLPQPEQVAEVPKNAARREVIAQASDFAAYRAKLAELAKAAPAREDGAQQSVSGKITPKVEETTPAPVSKDQLRLARTGSGKGPKADETERRIASHDDSVARDRALKEAQTKVSELEQNVKNLQALIELKNRSMAELQRQAKGGSASASATSSPAAAAPHPTASGAGTTAGAPGGVAANASASATHTPAANESHDNAKPVRHTESPSAAAPSPVSSNKLASVGGSQTWVWGSAAGLVALLGSVIGFALLRSRRRVETVRPLELEGSSDDLASRVRSAKETLMELRAAEAPGVEPVFADPAVADDVSVVAPRAVVEEPVVSQPAMPKRQAIVAAPEVANARLDVPSAIVPEPMPVDPPAVLALPDPAPEAKVEAVMAVAAAPVEPAAPVNIAPPAVAPAPAESQDDDREAAANRAAIHLELLRMYAERNEYEQFDALANELHRLTGGVGEEWVVAAALGRRVDPGNSLYAAPFAKKAAARAASVAAPAPVPAAPTPAAPAPTAPAPAVVNVTLVTPPMQSAPAPLPPSLEGVDFDLGEFSSSVPKAEPAKAEPVKVDAAKPEPAKAEPVSPDPVSSEPAAAVVPESAAIPASLGFGSISLDLDANAPAPAPAMSEAAAKLELARAYQEMGDMDGARELLNEVLQEGNAAEQSSAREVLAKLG